jgi:hypothetical protein
MSTVSGGSPVGLPAPDDYHPPSAQAACATDATLCTARTFDTQLGKLVEMKDNAVTKGKLVTEDRVDLDFQPDGLLLVARRGDVQFASATPATTPSITPASTVAAPPNAAAAAAKPVAPNAKSAISPVSSTPTEPSPPSVTRSKSPTPATQNPLPAPLAPAVPVVTPAAVDPAQPTPDLKSQLDVLA